MQNEEKRITRAERNRRRKSIFKLSDGIKPYGIKSEENKKTTRVERLKLLEYKKERIKLRTILFMAAILIIYFFIAVYFKSHFYFGSTINCINVSGKSIEEAYNYVKEETNSYVLTLKGRNGLDEKINGEDVNLFCNLENDEHINNIKKNQGYLFWLLNAFSKKEYEDTSILSYDEELLNKTIESLGCLEEENIIYPQNPTFKYENNKYEIVDEVNGTQINKEKLCEAIKQSVSKGETVLDIDGSECYEKPIYTSKSKEVLEAKKILNQYKDITITYVLGSKKEIIDGNTILDWFKFNDKFEVSINQDAINNYVYNLAQKYNTVGKTRNFVTTEGKTIQVSGGDYGWIIDDSKMAKDIINLLNGKQSVEKEPEYTQKGIADINNDIGNTYVEINLSKQHLYFYKEGVLVTEGDIVSGNVINGNATPGGVYSLKYKERNAVLVGDNYRSPVNFWMPFNNNIGIHDASWRGAFGGEIYIAGGSHGCVNAPYYLANDIFYNIEEGTPVICYY